MCNIVNLIYCITYHDLNPAPVNSGIVFKRTDIESASIKASLENVFDTRLSTSLSNKDIKISTVEHLLSALAGIGIDNALIELDGPEVPIMDGSARPFVFMIQSAGIQEQADLKKFIKNVNALVKNKINHETSKKRNKKLGFIDSLKKTNNSFYLPKE